MSLTVRVERSVIDRFRREAKKRFPKEAYAILLGTKAPPGFYYVSELWVPGDIERYSTTHEVTIPDHWAIEAHHYAAEESLQVVGDAHSHPFSFRECDGKLLGDEPSAGDWALGWRDICGITCIAQQKDGRLRSKTRFFGPAQPVTVSIIKVA